VKFFGGEVVVEVSIIELVVGGLSKSKELLVIITVWLVEDRDSGPKLLLCVDSTTLDDVEDRDSGPKVLLCVDSTTLDDVEVELESGLEIGVGVKAELEPKAEALGVRVGGDTSAGLIELGAIRARISVSVSSHATGTPSFQIVSVGLGCTVKKL